MDLQLIQKYDVPAPRYTSYPTVPYWESKTFSIGGWKQAVTDAFWKNGKELSLYIHLPFCESLCLYCGCHTYITKNHDVETSYINYVLKEWQMYCDMLPGKPVLKELHLGGGTPTFFQSQNLQKLIEGIFAKCQVDKEDISLSFEGHPANTKKEHLEALAGLGFSRISLGIQDFDPKVQKAINRIQTLEQVAQVTNEARALGFTSINYDLIYGLPHQTLDTISDTIDKIRILKPDRIAFYSYAHVPNMKPAQKSFEFLLPTAKEKVKLQKEGRSLLKKAGYQEIGLDHYALDQDDLWLAKQDQSLHRNFMGYTEQDTQFLIGLGVSSISDAWEAFAQNEKTLHKYKKALDEGHLPIIKGHLHSKEDLFFRDIILQIMCLGYTQWPSDQLTEHGLSVNWGLLDELASDGLLLLQEDGLRVTIKGRQYLRNIAMAFDARFWNSKNSFNGFSKAV